MIGGSSGGGNMRMGFSIYLKDQFSGPAAKIKSTLDGMRGEYSAYKSNLTAARNMAAAVATATLGISMGLYNAAMEGAEFLHIMQGVLAISEATGQEFERLKLLAVDLGRETIFTPSQVASGMRFMAMAGQTATQIQATAKDATYLAAATMTQLGGKLGAADILTNALKAFGLGVEQSTQMSDMLTYATTSANVSLVDLGNSIRYVASTSRNLNIPVQETIGFIMALGNAGIQSSMAGTALENMYRYLAKSISDFATANQKAVWQTLGLSKQDIMDSTGAFKPMVEVLGLLRQRLEGIGAVDTQNILKEIFGVRGQRAAGTILRNLDEAGAFVQQLNDPKIKGTAKSKSGLMMETLKGSSLKLTSALEGLKAAWAESLGNVFLKSFLVGLSKIIAGVTWFLKLPVVGTVASIAAGVLTLVGMFIGMRAVLYTIALAVDKITTSYGRMAAAGRVAMASVTGSAARYTGTAAAGGMMMMGGRAAPAVRGAVPAVARASWFSKLFRAGGVLRFIPMIGRGLGMLVGWLSGPIGIAIMLGVTFLPMLIGSMGSLTSATKANTEALAPPQSDVTIQELFMLLKDMTMGDLIKNINANHTEGLKHQLISAGYLEEMLGNDKGLATIMLHGTQPAGGDINIMVSPRTGLQTNTKANQE